MEFVRQGILRVMGPESAWLPEVVGLWEVPYHFSLCAVELPGSLQVVVS